MQLRRVATAVFVASLMAGASWGQSIVREARAAGSAKDFARGEQLIESYRAAKGVTPEMILALSWLGRGAQAAKSWELAEKYAVETRDLALEELKKRPLDADKTLPLALGASIEVQAHALAARNARSEALQFLARELKRWRTTSIRTRIQKNIHLLGLAGKPAPPLQMTEYIGAPPASVEKLKGKPVILFFWAHWCGDCKQQGPVLARLQQEYRAKGLVIVGPTQRYGYVARGADASPAEELKYIEDVRQKFYGTIEMAVPVSEENFKAWGSSTTPTLVVIDRAGLVKLYHPGTLSYEELAPIVADVVAD